MSITFKVMPAPKKLLSINEREEKDAQQLFYKRVDADMNKKKKKKLEFWRKVSIFYSPGFVLTFMMIYWIAGLKHADII